MSLTVTERLILWVKPGLNPMLHFAFFYWTLLKVINIAVHFTEQL